MKRAARPGEILGRDGKPVSRTRRSSTFYNDYDIPDHLRQPGWANVWMTTHVHGRPEPANVNAHTMNGWTPASPSIYKGVMPERGRHATIERDGLMLMERPEALNTEALAELYEDALELRQAQGETFGSRKLPKGYADGYAAKGGDARKKVNREGYHRLSPDEYAKVRPALVRDTGPDEVD